MTLRERAAATAAALLALMGLVGGAAYRAARDDASPSTSITASTAATSSSADLADVIADALGHDLEVPLSVDEARCVTDELLAVVSLDGLQELESLADPLATLDPVERDKIVRGVVSCVPADTAAALLGGSTTSTVPVELPGEGG